MEGKKIAKKNQLIAFTFASIQTAFTYLKEETGLLFVQLAPSPPLSSLKLKLVDSLHYLHQIPASQVPFLIQKRGKLAYQQIAHWATNRELDAASEAIKRLFQVVQKRCQMGIGDIDPDFSTNFAFIGKRAIQIDVGRFYPDESRKELALQDQELVRITRNFHRWIQNHYPLLLSSFEKALKEINES